MLSPLPGLEGSWQTCSIMFEVGIRPGRILGSKMLDTAYYVRTAYISELSDCILLNAALMRRVWLCLKAVDWYVYEWH